MLSSPAGDVKEFGFRPVPEGRLPKEHALPPLQPVPVQAPGMVADPRLALSIGVCGSIAAEEACASWLLPLLGVRSVSSLLRAWPDIWLEVHLLVAISILQSTSEAGDLARAVVRTFNRNACMHVLCRVSIHAPQTCTQDFQRVWQALSAREAQRLALVWEHEELAKLNSSILAFLKDQARRLIRYPSRRLLMMTSHFREEPLPPLAAWHE